MRRPPSYPHALRASPPHRPPHPAPRSNVYGKRSDYVLRSLWSTLLINMLYGASNPRIDNW